MTKPQLVAFVQQTSPENGNAEYNCHSWVQEVLKRSMEVEYLSTQTYTDAVDGMIAATLEAADEAW